MAKTYILEPTEFEFTQESETDESIRLTAQWTAPEGFFPSESGDTAKFEGSVISIVGNGIESTYYFNDWNTDSATVWFDDHTDDTYVDFEHDEIDIQTTSKAVTAGKYTISIYKDPNVKYIFGPKRLNFVDGNGKIVHEFEDYDENTDVIWKNIQVGDTIRVNNNKYFVHRCDSESGVASLDGYEDVTYKNYLEWQVFRNGNKLSVMFRVYSETIVEPGRYELAIYRISGLMSKNVTFIYKPSMNNDIEKLIRCNYNASWVGYTLFTEEFILRKMATDFGIKIGHSPFDRLTMSESVVSVCNTYKIYNQDVDDQFYSEIANMFIGNKADNYSDVQRLLDVKGFYN